MATHAGRTDAHHGVVVLMRGRRAPLAGACRRPNTRPGRPTPAIAALLVLLAVVAGAAADEGPAPLGPCGPIDRPYEAIELWARSLRRLGGTPLGQLGLVAYRDGRPHPIPFQVDERGNHKLAMPGGAEPTLDETPGVLDADDFLVFMACDAGERAPEADRDPEDRRWREIVLDDPRDGATGWVYVRVADAPPRTDRRYVEYDDAVDLVETAIYRIGMINTLPRYFAVALAGPLGPDLLDGARLRADATLLGHLAHWRQSEQDGRHRLIGWTAGPVRVVRRSKHKVELGMGIQLTAGVAHTYFYPRHVYGPGALSLPFSPAVFFQDIHGFGGADFRDLRGWRLVAPGTPAEGFLIDGTMSAAEQAFADDPPSPATWFALVREGEGLLVVLTMSEALIEAVPLELTYRDDETAVDAPEDAPGQVPLVGFRGRDVQRIEAGKYRFQLRAFMLPGYRPGDERRVLEQLAQPVSTFVSVPGWLEADRASGR